MAAPVLAGTGAATGGAAGVGDAAGLGDIGAAGDAGANGEKVIVAGLNIRPHRPHTPSGNPVLFASLEDETAMLQRVCLGEVIHRCTPTFLVAPAVMVVGEVERKGDGTMIKVENARPLTMKDYTISGRLTGQTGTRMDPVLRT